MDGITFFSKGWLIPVSIIALLFAILFLVLSQKTSGAKKYVRYAYLLKYLAIILLLLCLLDPQRMTQHPVKRQTSFLLLADNSKSMSTKHVDDKESKADELVRVLKSGEKSWQRGLKNNFNFHSYFFDHRLTQSQNLSELTFDGEASHLNKYLKELSGRFVKDKTGGILLFTDAILTDKKNEIDVEQLPAIFPVIIGKDKNKQDIWIKNVETTLSSFEDAPVSIRVDVGIKKYEGALISVDILDESKKIIASQRYANNGSSSGTLRFQLKDVKSGLQFYTVRVSEVDQLEQFTNPELSREVTLKNNTKLMKVDRRGGPYRILYVSGRPNWEYKYLSRAVQEDKQLEFVALIRIAKRESKFIFRAKGENADVNPLFKALDKDKVAAGENYDEPVFLRLNISDEKSLKKGFPDTKEELFSYHALIIDDCEAEFFNTDQLSLIHDFVSERGGGLLMLGGMESLQQGNYQKTALKDILPVYLNGSPIKSTDGKNHRYKLNLSREGWLQTWLRLYDNESKEEDRLNNMVSFRVSNLLKGIKPGAQVLASVKDNNDKIHPAFVVQRYGLGRSCVFSVGDFWRWGMKNPAERVHMEKAWRQMMRYLTADVPKFMDLEVTKGDSSGDPVHFEFIPRDKSFKTIDNLNPRIEITNEKGKVDIRNLKRDNKQSGLYSCDYFPQEKGVFKVRAIAGMEDQVEGKGEQIDAFYYCRQAPEEAHFLPDENYMNKLASTTGGRVLEVGEIENFINNIPKEVFKVMEEKNESLWNRGWIFLLIVVLFSAEWALRRSKGVA